MRLVRASVIYFGLAVLYPAGVILTGGPIGIPGRADRPGSAKLAGTVLQFIGVWSILLLTIPLLFRFVRWAGAAWRRHTSPGHKKPPTR